MTRAITLAVVLASGCPADSGTTVDTPGTLAPATEPAEPAEPGTSAPPPIHVEAEPGQTPEPEPEPVPPPTEPAKIERIGGGGCEPMPREGDPCDDARDSYCVLSWGEPGGFSSALWCRGGRWAHEEESNLD